MGEPLPRPFEDLVSYAQLHHWCDQTDMRLDAFISSLDDEGRLNFARYAQSYSLEKPFSKELIMLLQIVGKSTGVPDYAIIDQLYGQL